MITVYGSPLCPHCVALKKKLDEAGKKYTYINITESTRNLKMFLKLRDNNSLYDDAKKNNYIGIPTIEFPDGTLVLDWESLDIEELDDVENKMEEGSCCDFSTGRC